MSTAIAHEHESLRGFSTPHRWYPLGICKHCGAAMGCRECGRALRDYHHADCSRYCHKVEGRDV